MSLPDGLPSIIKVGHRNIKIVPWSSHYTSDRSAFGEYSSSMGEIRVCFDGRSDPDNGATLLHEILHAIWKHCALADEDNEERVVSSLSNGLAAAMCDNPAVFAWIAATLQA